MNIERSKELITQLVAQQVTTFCVCAGARNAPLVRVLDSAVGVEVLSFFDERAAAFFALGRAKRDGRAAAVITTSGTAAAELLPAAVEAYYSGVPIVLITADRPKSYRGSASPQAIEQVGIFSHYASPAYDLDKSFSDIKISAVGATHINICFAEPLIDGEVPVLQFEAAVAIPISFSTREQDNRKVDLFMSKISRPLVILGALPVEERARTRNFLLQLNAPVYAEALSGLRESDELAHLQIRSGVTGLTAKSFGQLFDSVIRFGAVPTLRLWRDLDGELKNVPVLSVSQLPFSGLGRAADEQAVSFVDFWQSEFKLKVATADWAKHEQDANKKREYLLQQYPLSETGMLHALSEHISSESNVFLGNSLPIREWDQSASFSKPHPNIVANRGANGIDGLISTFLGWAATERENWLILGDLSALYDLNALALPTEEKTVRIVVVNNGGGQIFSRLFQDSRFLNRHSIGFEHWAKMFNYSYLKIQHGEFNKLSAIDTRVIIELVPDMQQTVKFGQEWGGPAT